MAQVKGAAASLLDVYALSIHFGGVAAVADVDLRVMRGEVHALVGPNGSGKTTLLNAVSGFVRAQSGSIKVNDRMITRAGAHRRAALGIGRTFQNPRLTPNDSVLDILELGLYIRDRRTFWRSAFRPLWVRKEDMKYQHEAEEVLARVGLDTDLLHRNISTLSHGQVKMVDVCRALLARPQLLLLDEPAAGLNATETDILRALIIALRNDDVSVLVVEHNVQFVLDLADRATVLDRGRCVATGAPRETLGRPEVVEAYVGRRTARRVLRNDEDGVGQEAAADVDQ